MDCPIAATGPSPCVRRSRSARESVAILSVMVFAAAASGIAAGRAYAAPTVNACGTVASDTVWTAGNVYVIDNCAATVAAGVTLTVQPGTIVKFGDAGDLLLVQGALMAQGTAGAPIAFTSLRDDSQGGDSNGDGASEGHAKDWSGLRFAAGSHGRLAHVIVGFGGSGVFDRGGRYGVAELESFSSDVTLDHVTLRSSGNGGLYCDNASVQVAYGQVIDNAGYGLYWNGVDASVPLVVSDTTFSSNGAGAGWMHFRDAPGTVTFQRNSAAGAKNGFKADGRLNGGSVLWDNAGDLPLLVTPGVQIAAATTVRLMPGSVVKFSGATSTLDIQGTLQSEGTVAAPIVFTSERDDSQAGDTNGDGASTGAPGQWASVRFESGSQGRFAYTSFAYGGSGAYDYAGRYGAAMFESFSSDVTLDHVTLRGSGNSGLYCDAASVRVTNGQVADNTSYGLYWNGVDPSVPLLVSDTIFSANGTAAGWLHFRDVAGTVTFERNAATGPRNGFRADGRLNQGSLTWNNGDDLPLLINGGLTIAPATTLALEPGTIVKFGDVRDVLLVQGTLDALGTAGNPIALTSVADDAHGGDTNGDGVSQGQPGQWSGLRFAAGSTGQLAYVFIGYGASGAYDYAGRYGHGMVESFSSAVALEHCTLHASARDGLYAENATVAFTNGAVTGNAWYGLNYNGLDPVVPLVVTGNAFSGSQGGAARLDLQGNPSQITFQGNSGSGTNRRGFSLAGTLTTDTVWDNTGSLPLVIDGGLTVAQGATLTVQPGTVVKFAGGRDVLFVQGTLIALGTDTAPIALTSLRDDAHGGDTNGDGASSGVGGDWSAVRFAAGSTGWLAHVFVGFGGSGAYDYAGRYTAGMLESFSSDVTLDHCTVQASAQNGLYAAGVSLAVTDSWFTGNQTNGAYFDGIDPATPLTVRDDSFAGNGANGAWVRVGETAGHITAEHNHSLAPKNGFRLNGGLTQGELQWDNPDAPMVIDGGFAVRASAALTLGAGSIVKFAGVRDVLQIEGALVAEGTIAAPIALTSISDDAHGGDTNGDGASSGTRGQWAGLRMISAGNVSLRHCFLGYGGSAAYDHQGYYGRGLVDVRNGHVDIAYATVRNSALHGLYRENGDVKIAYSAITEHTQNGIYNDTPATSVDARHNWWGDASGPKHPTLNPSGTGSLVSDGVVFDPWLSRFSFLEPTTLFVHGVATLSWTALDTDPSTLTTDVEAAGSDGVVSLGHGLAATADTPWDTRSLVDGPYELRANWRNAAGALVGDAVRAVIVNNDPDIAWHGGRLNGNETWSADRLHVVESDVIVGTGVRLTIEPGAIVKFAPGTRIVIEDAGIVDALGNSAAPIILTSIVDDVSGDTNLDGPQSLPRAGDWNGVVTRGAGQFNSNEFVDLRYSRSEHAGVVSANETWRGAYVHQVTGDVTIPTGVTLTVEPGAVVKFDSYKGIVVQPGGRVVADATVAQSIVFTSVRDDTAGGDTNGDGDQTTPQAGDWRWIYVDGADASFDHVEMRYGGGTSSGSWDYTGVIRTTPGATVALSNSVIRDGFFECILAWGGGTVTVTSSVLAGCDRGVNSDGAAVVRILNSTLDGNKIGLWGHGGQLEVSNTIISHSLEAGISNPLHSPLTLQYSDVWSPQGANYVSTTDQTGSNGNISADPRFKDRERGDYRLNYVSPAIDAADGGVAPATDIAGAPRDDDPRTPDTGIATAGGAYPDMGAYEFAETADSDIDLVVTSVVGPTDARPGDTVTIEWTVTNVGTGVAVGPWHDAISLIFSPETAPVMVSVGEVVAGAGVRLGAGQSYVMRADVTVSGGVVGPHYWEVTTNVRGEVFEGRFSENDSTRSLTPCALDLPELVVDGPMVSGQFNGSGEARWFKLTLADGESVQVSLDLTGVGAAELFGRYDEVPSREAYDTRSPEWNTGSVTLLVSEASAGTYYILALPQRATTFPASFTIAAQTADFRVVSVTPSRGGNAGPVTITVAGEAFPDDAGVRLIPAGGTPLTPRSQQRADATRLVASFDLAGAATGLADVVVSGDAGATSTLVHGFEIVAGGNAEFWFEITGPDRLRAGRQASFDLRWGNRGAIDAPMQLIDMVLPSNVDIALAAETAPLTERLLLLTAVPNVPEAVIPAGFSDHRTLYVTPRSVSSVALDAGAVAINDPRLADVAIDWTTLGPAIRPAGMSDAEWDAAWAQFMSQMGSTWFDMLQRLSRDAAEISEKSVPADGNGEVLGGVPVLEALLMEFSAVIRALGWSDWESALPLSGLSLDSSHAVASDGYVALADQPRPGGQTYALVATGQYYSGATSEANLWASSDNHLQVVDFLTKTTQVPGTNIKELKYGVPRVGDDENDKFTGQNFKHAIENLANNKRSDDTLFVYLGGHGLKGQFEVPDGTFINYMSDIYSKLNKSKAGKIVVVVDSCYSGSFTDALMKNPNVDHKRWNVMASTASNDTAKGNAHDGGFTFTKKFFGDKLRDGGSWYEAKQKLGRLWTWSFPPRNQDPQWFGDSDAGAVLSDRLGKAKHKVAKEVTTDCGGTTRLRTASVAMGQVTATAVPCPPGATRKTVAAPVVGSSDPNEKLTIGVGNRGYTDADAPITYSIYFENDPQHGATAPVQEVLITDQLSPLLDWSSLRLATIGFGDERVSVPAGHDSFTALATVPYDANPVTIDVSLDRNSGIVTWHMASRDPVTGQLPEDPDAGFLPVNDSSGRGQGFVTLTVWPVAKVSRGTAIRNRATIVFDPTYGVNPPIETNEVFNTIGPMPECSGDCDGSGQVTIDELLTLVNIALGTAQAEACVPGDQDENGAVTIDELLAAVNSALSGCPGGGAALVMPCAAVVPRPAAPPTPTLVTIASATPTATPTESSAAEQSISPAQ